MVSVKAVITILAYCVAVLGYLPVLIHADWVARLAVPLALVLGIAFDRRDRHVLSGVPSTLFTVAAFTVYLLQWSRSNPAAPVINFLVMLLAVRLVNEKSPRNLLQIFALSLFLLAGSSLFSLSALFLVYLTLLLALIAVALVLLTFRSVDEGISLSSRALRRVVTAGLVMPAASLPLLVVFFSILPRTQFPLLGFLNAPGEKTTGLSERVEPGTSSSVAEVRTVAFRAESERLERNALYWRGLVLDTVTSTGWVRGAKSAEETASPVKGKTVRQVIYPEPSRTTYLVGLNVPIRMDGVRSRQSSDFTYINRGRPGGRIRYEVQSVLADSIAVRGKLDRKHYLALPERMSGRTVALARRLTAAAEDDAAKLERLEAWFRDAGFSYATTGLPVSDDPVDAFLFESKKGHCEFFASSFARLLRVAGVPARLVGGYYGGEYNELAGYYLITEDRAHVWVEAFIEGRGWVMVDPSSFAVNFDRVGETNKPGIFGRLTRMVDSLSYLWIQTVITYDLQKQVELVRTANSWFRDLRMPANTRLVAGSAVVFLVLLVGACILRRLRPAGRKERLLKRFLARLARSYGLPQRIDPSWGLAEIVADLNDPAATEFVAIYGGALYRDRCLTSDEERRLEQLLSKIGEGKQRQIAP